MINKTYKCDLCSVTCPSDTANVFLVGLYWEDYPKPGWVQRLASETNHHICKTCLISLQIIGDNKKPSKDAAE